MISSRAMSSVIPAIFLAGSLGAAEPPSARFAESWLIDPTETQPLWRVTLTPEIMQRLHQDDASDLLVTDNGGQPVPFHRLSRRYLVEPLEERQSLDAQASLVTADRPERDPLELELQHDGTRLVVRAPGLDDQRPQQGRLVFEALVGAPERRPPLARHTLWIELESLQPLRLDCRLRDADDDRPASRRVELERLTDTVPRRYLARLPIEVFPRAWHLGCYGQQVPADLILAEVALQSSGEHDHRQIHRFSPEVRMDGEPGSMAFELDGPWRVRQIFLVGREPSLLSSVLVQSRAREEDAWTDRARLTLSTLEESLGVSAPLIGAERLRHRHWRVLSSPAMRQPPALELESEVEELVFLAQGEAPWRLYAGSRDPGRVPDPEPLLDDAVDRLGPAWTWPLISPGERSQAAGESAVHPLQPPVPWQRFLLWLVLILGAGAVAWSAFRLLRQSGD